MTQGLHGSDRKTDAVCRQLPPSIATLRARFAPDKPAEAEVAVLLTSGNRHPLLGHGDGGPSTPHTRR